MIRVWTSLPMLATDCPPPWRASALPRSAFQLPTSVSVYSRASFWRSSGSAVRSWPRASVEHVGEADVSLAFGGSSSAASPARRPSMPPLGPGLGEPGVRAAGADAGALEVERRLGDRPAVALAADEVGVVAHGLVEEHLVEHRVAGHLPQRADRHSGLVELEREPRDAARAWRRRSRCGRAACRSRPPWPCCSTPSGR